MTTIRLPRRALVGAILASSLIGSGLIAASAADAPCTTFTDPKGDSAPADAPMIPAPEDDLDITGVAFDTLDNKLAVSVYVAELNVAPEYSFGDYFSATFKHGGKAIELYAYRYNPTDIGDGLSNLYDQTGMDVEGDAATTSMTVTYDVKASKVVFTLPLEDIDKATKTPTAGAAFTTLAAQASGDEIAFSEPWDDAAAPKDMTYAVGTTCGGGAAAPAPVPSASPSAAPSPSASPAPAPSGAPAPAAAGLPAADCFLTKDPKGDAIMRPVNGAPGDPGAPNDPDLDVTALTLGTDAKNLNAYIKVDALAAGPAITEGHRFYVTFTFNKHSFTMAGSAFKNGEAPIRDGAHQTGQVAGATQLAVDGVSSAIDPERFTGAGTGFVDSGLKYTFDVKNSYVIASLPLTDLEKYGKAPSAGAVLTGVYASGNADNFATAIVVDSAPDGASSDDPASKLTYGVGDNHCFAPPAPPLTSIGALKAQYGDIAAVAAKLVDAAGAPVAGKPVTFTLGSSKAVGTTGADGIAKAALLVKEKAGKRSLVITSGDATATVPFTVVVEKTVLKAVGGKGGVTATLTDDDRKPVAGQVITFASGSKKLTARTNAQGVAKVTGLPPGNVKVSYAGAPGMYAAASTTTKA